MRSSANVVTEHSREEFAMIKTGASSRRAFALPELAASILVLLVLWAMLLPTARHARSAGWDAVDAENLHRFAAATTAYAADNGDRYWTFSWRADMGYASDTAAASAQAIDILRRKAGRGDINLINGWLPYPMYSQLALYDYLDERMPALWGVCPADRIRKAWAMDPPAFDEGEFLPCQPTPGNDNKRWPYSSSYQLSTSFYDQGGPANRVTQAGNHNFYNIPGGAELYARRLGETAFPSQKVHLFELSQHHMDEDVPDRCEDGAIFFRPEARIAMLFCDGHAAMMATSEANPGWQPNQPNSPDPTCVELEPGECLPLVYRWTRRFLDGRDFGGPEVGPP
jgi:prepilin-type processing-associated H-X9-DG protein